MEKWNMLEYEVNLNVIGNNILIHSPRSNAKNM